MTANIHDILGYYLRKLTIYLCDVGTTKTLRLVFFTPKSHDDVERTTFKT